jgi:hypothetical protein
MSTVTLPNSLTRNPKIDLKMSGRGGNWFYLYCASCGKDGGRVRESEIPNREEFAFYLCNDCAEKYGPIANTMMIPDALFFQKIREAQLEKEGRELEAFEIVEALKDPAHYLSKLANDRNTFLASE